MKWIAAVFVLTILVFVAFESYRLWGEPESVNGVDMGVLELVPMGGYGRDSLVLKETRSVLIDGGVFIDKIDDRHVYGRQAQVIKPEPREFRSFVVDKWTGEVAWEEHNMDRH